MFYYGLALIILGSFALLGIILLLLDKTPEKKKGN